MRLFLRHKMAGKTRKRLLRQIKGPKGYQREFQGPTISGSLEILPNRMLFRIPAFPAHSVSLSSRTDAAFWIRESLPILHPEILSRFTLTHDLCGDTSIYIYIYICGASSARDSRDWPWEVPSFIRETYPPESFFENLYGSTINLS